VEELGLGGQIRFVGYVPREAIPARYAAAHVFVLPSYNEGMSVATLEAMAAGLPVVVTRTAGTTDLVEEGVNGLTFDWADVDALTDHLRRLASDRALARDMGAACRARAKAFSWDQAAAFYLHMLCQVAGGASASGQETTSRALAGPG
jgi:glycosyltransferase involved in cell wall biosynthesis